jgi:hypothetical protein
MRDEVLLTVGIHNMIKGAGKSVSGLRQKNSPENQRTFLPFPFTLSAMKVRSFGSGCDGSSLYGLQ